MCHSHDLVIFGDGPRIPHVIFQVLEHPGYTINPIFRDAVPSIVYTMRVVGIANRRVYVIHRTMVSGYLSSYHVPTAVSSTKLPHIGSVTCHHLLVPNIEWLLTHDPPTILAWTEAHEIQGRKDGRACTSATYAHNGIIAEVHHASRPSATIYQGPERTRVARSRFPRQIKCVTIDVHGPTPMTVETPNHPAQV